MNNKVKIISNPYEKRISFQRWDNSLDAWSDLSNPNSDLFKGEYTTGFFPFKAKKIVDQVLKDFRVGQEKVEITFEGTTDEYRELQAICESEAYTDSINLEKSDIELENARDILPDIIEVFKSLNPLVAQSVSDQNKIRRELDKFSDASNDIIPVCVLGNYSSGKSTFINALIGGEILPSSDKVATARTYKIQRSDYDDRATIKFEFDSLSVVIKFDEEGYKFSSALIDNPLTDQLRAALDKLNGKSLVERLNVALVTINNYANDDEVGDRVSDLIEIDVPFNSGVLGEKRKKFVIFDTPGSNSATHDKHMKVLKKAMEDMSNGLPIYVAKNDSLDSTDNELLYKEIKSMEELDCRFTMIVVNQADEANLPKEGFTPDEEKHVLGEAVPKNLYSNGIYFVSSIMGLGAKNGGDFLDDHCAEIFEEKEKKFKDKESRFYKTLYKYNIMPEQIKKKAVDYSEHCPNTVLANSGLYCVEQEIDTFANKYSSYNKCQQSQMFLLKIIEITGHEIDEAKKKREEDRQHRREVLERDKAELIDLLEHSGESSKTEFSGEYALLMDDRAAASSSEYSSDELKALESDITRVQEERQNFKGRDDEVNESLKAIAFNFVDHFQVAVKERNLEAVKSIGTGLYSDISKTAGNISARNETRHEVDKAAAQELLLKIKENFESHGKSTQALFDESSREFWAFKTEESKKRLADIVTKSTALTEEKRDEIEKIIMTYADIDFASDAEEIFLRGDFSGGLRLGDIVIVASDKLNKEKLSKTYNSKIEEQIQSIKEAIKGSHEASFISWFNSLLTEVTNNITDFSPVLRNQVAVIDEDTNKINELERKRNKLSQYAEQIKKMMEWRHI